MRAEERITALHGKMAALTSLRERQKTRAYGTASLALTVCLLILVSGGSAAHSGGPAGIYSGATMLFENAGIYVLLAIGAFMAGVIVTVVIIKSRKKEKHAELKKHILQ